MILKIRKINQKMKLMKIQNKIIKILIIKMMKIKTKIKKKIQMIIIQIKKLNK